MVSDDAVASGTPPAGGASRSRLPAVFRGPAGAHLAALAEGRLDANRSRLDSWQERSEIFWSRGRRADVAFGRR